MSTTTPHEIWNDLRNRAKAVGWTMKTLCERARVHRTTVDAWRTNDASPNMATVNRLELTLQRMEQAVRVLDAGVGQ